jgi:hypothetical protein
MLSRALARRDLRLVVGLACLTFIAAMLIRQIAFQPLRGVDFIFDYAAASAIRNAENPYQMAVNWAINYAPGDPLLSYYFYAPTYATLLVPLSFVPYDVALLVWTLCNFSLLCIAIYALMRSTGKRVSTLMFILLVAAAVAMSSVHNELFLGNVNLFMVACVCAAYWRRQAGHSLSAGLLLALAIATKPMLLGVIPFLLWKREFKFALTAVAASIVYVLVPFFWLGTHALGDLITLWRFYSSQYLSFTENITIRGILERLFTVNPYVPPIAQLPPFLITLMWLVFAATIVLMTLAVVSSGRMQRDSKTMLEFGLVILAVLVVSPLTETPYLVFLIIPLFASLNFLMEGPASEPQIWLGYVSLFALWFYEVTPRTVVEAWFMPQTPSRVYLLIGMYVMQLFLVSYARGLEANLAVARLVRHAPRLIVDWGNDFVVAYRRWRNNHTDAQPIPVASTSTTRPV